METKAISGNQALSIFSLPLNLQEKKYKLQKATFNI